jgi:hypothetical protein
LSEEEVERKREIMSGEKWVLFVKCFYEKTSRYVGHVVVDRGERLWRVGERLGLERA